MPKTIKEMSDETGVVTQDLLDVLYFTQKYYEDNTFADKANDSTLVTYPDIVWALNHERQTLIEALRRTCDAITQAGHGDLIPAIDTRIFFSLITQKPEEVVNYDSNRS